MDIALAERSIATSRAGRSPDTYDQRVTRRVLILTCAVVVAVRAVFVAHPIRSDEGGYLMAARHWAPGEGEFLYGDFHVDRPPALMAFFRLAAMWETDAAIRVITIPVVVGIVLTTALAAGVLAGPVAARWAAVVTAALMCSPALAADQADGEMFALIFVTGSIVAVLKGRQALGRGAVHGYGMLAGALAATAPLVKQNFLDAFVFAAVLLVVTARRDQGRRAQVVVLAGGFGAGALIPLAVMAAWVLLEGVEPQLVWSDLVTFRAQAADVLASSHRSAPLQRAQALVLVAVVSSAVPIIVVWSAWLLRRPRPLRAEHWALLALVGWSTIGIAAGGSYWLHYLQAAVPGVALAAGLVIADRHTWRSPMRVLALWAVGVSLVGVIATALVYQTTARAWYPQLIGWWVAASAEEGDTIVVAYGNPQVVEAADLATPYPYLWSLQMRTLDPEQRQLERLLAGPSPPTWFVVLNGVNSWDIDDDSRLRELLDERYEPAAEICGYEVLVHADAHRRLAATPRCR